MRAPHQRRHMAHGSIEQRVRAPVHLLSPAVLLPCHRQQSACMHALRVCIIPEARCRDHGSHFLWHDQLWTKVDNQNPKEEKIKKVAHKTSTGSSVVFATALQCGMEPWRLARVTKRTVFRRRLDTQAHSPCPTYPFCLVSHTVTEYYSIRSRV